MMQEMLKYIDEEDVIYTDVKVLRILHSIFILKLCNHYT